jgi:acetoacetyl-CoA synthetase
MTKSEILWNPDRDVVESSELTKFVHFVQQRHGVTVDERDYSSIHDWSVSHLNEFWSSVADFCGVKFHRSPTSTIEHQKDIARTKWFPGSSLNYAEHALDRSDGRDNDALAILFEREDGLKRSMTYGELREQVSRARAGLIAQGVRTGDRVVALAPNCIETLVAFLASASLGAIWASCSPDFGARAVSERFAQLEPTVLIAVDGYLYTGRQFDIRQRVEQLQKTLPSLKSTVLIPYVDELATIKGTIQWNELTAEAGPLHFEPVPFDHPLWVLYSSGTTGPPKGIVHSHGGIVVEHLKVLRLQNGLGPGDRYFWFTTTGWMMWNFLVGGLLVGATIVLYDGNPGYPRTDALWDLADRLRIKFFGISAAFIHSHLKAGTQPSQKYNLSSIRMLGATGSPLSPAGYHWVSQNVGDGVQISSGSGGTDVCTTFVCSAPNVPVWVGEISCAALGCRVEAVDDAGRSVVGEVGELVLTTPMPSMPVMFWNDADGSRLHAAYFEDIPGSWRHGDWVMKTSHGSYIIYGRSDSTLNRGGVRMGTADFYSIIEDFDGVADSMVVHTTDTANPEDGLLICFLVLRRGVDLEKIEDDIRAALRAELSPRHVPDRFLFVNDIPRTLNGKKCEVPVKRILEGVDPEKVVSRSAMQNPEALEPFIQLSRSFKSRGWMKLKC